ncbi:MAG TPA: beta-galactosidase [Verrucomicrobiota bacterium]|jgi:beta-galactosidase|nr:MAG: Beta-galactosidase bgaB [Verrucomicrobia bacterium ADurb.Bin118]HPY32020.1 beta-galactosidase [Verrucomicrobiota bacterium]HQB18191.1 beta-galactosidase [Verrucomicrobiota bacterium]
MYFGVDYYPEHWVYPYGGTPEHPEACWDEDIALMREAGFNAVRMGEFTWGLCEREDGKFDFDWLRRAMDRLHQAGIKVILATPTAAPPIWLTRKHPEILPLDENLLTKHAGTRRAICLSSDAFWEYSKRIVTAMAKALGDHPALIAWQIDNAIGGNFTEESFNEDSREEWHFWLQAKYETIERLNERLGLRHWGQVVNNWDEVPMPLRAPTMHNPALALDWRRFCSDTMVQYIKMQVDLLHELTPERPVTTNLKPLIHRFDHFDLAEVLDFISAESAAVIRAKSAEAACEIDMLRSLKKTGVRTPDGKTGFWVIEHKAGNVSWQDVNSLVRPGIIRMFTYQLISRGADAILFFRWRQPRIGTEQFHGAVMSHRLRKENRVFREISQLGEEIKLLAPVLKGTQVVSEVAILYTHDNEWALQQPNQPNRHFRLRDHIQLIYTALHDRDLRVDFVRPTDDLSQYRLVFAPSLFLLAGGEADRLKLYVQNGGTLVGTFNSGLVDEYHMAPDTGYPHDLIDLFGLEVVEFDTLPPNAENHLTFKGAFQTSHLHPARLWCDIIEPHGCQILATYSKDFYAGKPAVTLNEFGLGKAIYIGTQSHQNFYYDLVVWLRQLCNLHSLLKVPDTVEVSLRQKEGVKVFFLLNHQSSPVRLQFYKPMHDYLTGSALTGNYDLPPHGVLVLGEQPSDKT